MVLEIQITTREILKIINMQIQQTILACIQNLTNAAFLVFELINTFLFQADKIDSRNIISKGKAWRSGMSTQIKASAEQSQFETFPILNATYSKIPDIGVKLYFQKLALKMYKKEREIK